MVEMDERAASVKLNRSVQRVSRLLQAVASRKEGLTLTELSHATALPESTVYRLLATLEGEGFVERATDGSARFQIGLEVFRLGSTVLDRLGIGQHVLAYLEDLAAWTGETVNLGALQDFRVLYLQKVESQNPLRASLIVGATVPAHCSANGKMLLAQLDPDRLDALLATHPLEPRGPRTILDTDALRKELRSIRARGYAVDDLEFADDIRAVAAPILNHAGETVAAVAVAGPATRLTLARIDDEVAPRVVETGRRISARLGHRG